MEDREFVLDITNMDIDITLDKRERALAALESLKNGTYNKKIEVNGTVVSLNFLSDKRLDSEMILSAFA